MRFNEEQLRKLGNEVYKNFLEDNRASSFEEAVSKEMYQALEDQRDDIIRQAIGFERGSWGDRKWKLDRCNGRVGVVDRALKDSLQDKFTEFISKHVSIEYLDSLFTEEELDAIRTEARDYFLDAFDRKVREMLVDITAKKVREVTDTMDPEMLLKYVGP